MSKALELAKECGDTTTDSRGRVDYSFDSYGVEKFFRRAQAMALRDAAREFRKGDPAPKHWAVLALEQKADELEAGK